MSERGGLGVMGWVALAVAAVTCGTIAFAVSQGPKRVTIDDYLDSQGMFDPKPGTKFDLGSLAGSPLIIVTLGDCTGCSILRTDIASLEGVGVYRVVGVYKKDAEVTPVSDQYPWLKVVEDVGGFHKSFNSYFSPRAYAFSSGGELLLVQNYGESLLSFVERLGGRT